MIPQLWHVIVESSLRVSVVAAVVAGVLLAARVRSGGVRHAAWTAVLCAMLLMPVLPSLVPSITIPMPAAAQAYGLSSAVPTDAAGPGDMERALLPTAVPALTPAPDALAPAMPVPPAPAAPIWPMVALGLYAAGLVILSVRLLFGLRAMRRIGHSSQPIDPARLPGGAEAFESGLVATPLAIGVTSPRIILPTTWTMWPEEKVRAVLAHELAHIRRRDPLVGFLAHVNRCVFWFHPLAWWLERKLAATAEDACDDAAVRAIGQPRRYAEVLLDIADAVRRRGSRVSWQGVGVDGNGLLSQRIDRILGGDLFRDISRTRKVIVAVTCAAAIVLAVACRQQVKEPAPLEPDPEVAQLFAQEQAERDLYKAAWAMSPQQVVDLQAEWKKHPEDLAAARKLLLYYEPVHDGVWTPDAQRFIPARRAILLWLIAHHPDHELTARSSSLSPLPIGSLPDPVGYEQAKALWMAQVAKPDVGAHALSSAATFFSDTDKPQAERILLRALELFPTGGEWTVGRMYLSGRWTRRLGNLYAGALLGAGPASASHRPAFSLAEAHGPFAQSVRRKLEASTDAALLGAVASSLLYQDAYLRDARPALDDVAALGRAYLDRALKLDPTLVEAREALVQLHGRERWADEWGVRTAGQPIKVSTVPGWGTPTDQATHREKQLQAARALTDAERFAYLPDLADEAYRYGDSDDYYRHDTPSAKAWWALSRTYAQDLLALAPKFTGDPFYSAAVYRANIALGTLALRDGDRASAVGYMKKAAQVPASDELAFGNGSLEWHLVNFLLKYGERESVADFLERTAPLLGRSKDQRLKDAANICAGRMPRSYQSMVAHQ